MANASQAGKNQLIDISGAVFTKLASGAANPIPAGFPGLYADSSGILQVADSAGNLSPIAGEELLTITADATITAGQWVYASAASHANLAQANALSTAATIGVCPAAVASAATGPVQTSGIFTTTGLTTGSYYYLSASSAGAITTTAPSAVGQYVVPVGYAISTTSLVMLSAPAPIAVGVVATPTGFTTWWTGNVGIALATAGNDTAASNGDIYWAAIPIGTNATITGINFLIGSVGGTNNVIVGLYSSAGALLASSALAGTLVGTAANFQPVPFTAPLAVAGPGLYYAAVQFNGTTAKWRSHTAPGQKFVAGTVAGVFGTMAAITPGSTYTANTGPICCTY